VLAREIRQERRERESGWAGTHGHSVEASRRPRTFL
jgi:hypothetical protein